MAKVEPIIYTCRWFDERYQELEEGEVSVREQVKSVFKVTESILGLIQNGNSLSKAFTSILEG